MVFAIRGFAGPWGVLSLAGQVVISSAWICLLMGYGVRSAKVVGSFFFFFQTSHCQPLFS